MELKTRSNSIPQRGPGWIAVGAMTLVFAALFILNYLVPLSASSYTTRIWSWSELAIFLTALVVLALRWRSVGVKFVVIGAALGLLSGLSYAIRANTSPLAAATHGVSVWVIFVAGSALFAGLSKDLQVAAFRPPLPAILRAIGVGIVFALPLAVVNNLFFFFQEGAPVFQNLFYSAFEALKPGIHEETIFRYFVLAFSLNALQADPRRKLALAASIALAVIPHSLMHLPDLFLDNPLMGVIMLVATSLLFGLPMALLQVKRSFESAVAFHWFIDFARFYFGY